MLTIEEKHVQQGGGAGNTDVSTDEVKGGLLCFFLFCPHFSSPSSYHWSGDGKNGDQSADEGLTTEWKWGKIKANRLTQCERESEGKRIPKRVKALNRFKKYTTEEATKIEGWIAVSGVGWTLYEKVSTSTTAATMYSGYGGMDKCNALTETSLSL